MPTSCVAAKCKSLGNTHKMHRFPANPKRRMEWAAMVNRSNFQPSPYSYLCENHFDENQYENGRADGRKLLKINAIPTLFPATGHQAPDGQGHKPFKTIAPRPTSSASSTPNSKTRHEIIEGNLESPNADPKKHDHTYCSPQITSGETQSMDTTENPERDLQTCETIADVILPTVSSLCSTLTTTAPPTVDVSSTCVVPSTGVQGQFQETFIVVSSQSPCPVTVPVVSGDTDPQAKGLSQTAAPPIVQESELKDIFTVVTLPSHIVVPPNTRSPLESQTVGSSRGLSEEAVKLKRLSKKFEALRKRMVFTQRLNHEYRRNMKRLQFSKDEQEAKFKKLFAPDQLAVLGKPSSRGMKWSNETIEKGLRLLFACGKKGYEMLLEQGHPLPSLRTLRGRLQPLKYENLTRDGEPGSLESELEENSECDNAEEIAFEKANSV